MEKRKKEILKMLFQNFLNIFFWGGGQTNYYISFDYNNNKLCISNKMVSQVHTITNKSRLAVGPVKGLPGYNPFLTVPILNVKIFHMSFTFSQSNACSEAQSEMGLVSH